MQKTDGSIKSYGDDYEREDFLFTYSDEEKQRHEINEANAKLVFQPKFVLFDLSLLELGLTYLECLLYGFISFYLKEEDKFYFTNEQLASMFRSGERTITGALSNLERLGLIKNKYKQRANGGKIRFIQLAESAIGHKQKPATLNSKNCQKYINNKNNNKIDSSKEESNIYSPEEKTFSIKNFDELEVEHPQAPVEGLGFYDFDDPYVQSMMKNKNFWNNNWKSLQKLMKKGYTIDTIKTVCAFIKQDSFWCKNIRSLNKLLEKNKDGVMYIDVMIDKIQQWKPRNNFIPSF